MGNFDRSRSRGGRDFGRGRDFGGRSSDNRGSDRQMFTATCSRCGDRCEVPFKPTSGKPIFCSKCFEENGNRRDGGSRSFNDRPSDNGSFNDRAPRRNFSENRNDAPSKNSDQYKYQFEALNTKLDKLITLLTPKAASKEEAQVAEKPVKAKKKTSKKKE